MLVPAPGVPTIDVSGPSLYSIIAVLLFMYAAKSASTMFAGTCLPEPPNLNYQENPGGMNHSKPRPSSINVNRGIVRCIDRAALFNKLSKYWRSHCQIRSSSGRYLTTVDKHYVKIIQQFKGSATEVWVLASLPVSSLTPSFSPSL